MSTSDEKRQEILQLLATGKITAVTAAEMLSGAGQSEPAPEKQPAPRADLDDLIKVEPDPALKAMKATESETLKQPSWLRVRVSDLKSGRNKVTVNIPMRLIRFGLAVGSRFSPELDGLDWDELSHSLSSERGVLVDVRDEEDGEHVQIIVE
jgi:hypothetical protein